MDSNSSKYDDLRDTLEAEPLLESVGALVDFATDKFSERPVWIPADAEGPALTYRDLGRLIAKSANAFVSMGVKNGSHVALIMSTTPEHLCAWVALAKIGAVSVGVNPSYTATELGYTLTDSKVDFLLIASEHLPNFEKLTVAESGLSPERVAVFGPTQTPFQSWADELNRAADSFDEPSSKVLFDDPANILYTSGSTGFPKGCVLPHSYWIIKGKVMAALWPDVTRIQCDAPFFYMGPLWRFAFACYLGASLCVSPKGSLTRFVTRWKQNKIDFGWVNNAMSMTSPGEADGENSLSVLGTSGISLRLHRDAEARFNAPIREHYGMTEIGLAIVMPKEAIHMVGSGSCGVVAPFRECLIADENGEPVQLGKVGELYVSGPGIVKEYIGKPEANQQGFRGKWFRTGDLFWQDDDGYFYFHSRIKDIIRRSSENISATEVEAALTTIPEIEEVAVGPIKDPMRGEEVKAFIILKPGTSPEVVNPARILEQCSQLLARYKLPRYFQYYTAFPRTGSNKIAKKLLLDGQGEAITKTFDVSSGQWS